MSETAEEQGENPACNICGAPASPDFGIKTRFACHHCDSQDRHRCLKDAMDNGGLADAMSLAGKTLLVCHLIKPELRLFAEAERLVNFNIRPLPGLEICMDIQDMPQIPTGTVDGLIAIHVLNHVRDEARALAEIRRVLKAGGFFLSTVGYDANLPTQEIADQSRDYGSEALEKYAVDTYRKYNPDAYLAMLRSVMPSQPYLGRDPMTGFWEQSFLSRKP